MSKLLDVLEKCTAADLEEIDKQIDITQKRLDSLTQARKLIDLKVNGKPERKKPTRSAVGTGGGPGSTKIAEREQRIKAVALYLFRNGPKMVQALADATGVNGVTIYDYVKNSPWFEKGDDGRVNLTLEGRRAVDPKGG